MARDDAPPKSAYELAMERLRAQDRAAGVEHRPLSDGQKEEIRELRAKAQARLAELEILHDKHRADAQGDPAKLDQIEEHYEIDRRRIESKLEDDVAAVKRR